MVSRQYPGFRDKFTLPRSIKSDKDAINKKIRVDKQKNFRVAVEFQTLSRIVLISTVNELVG